MGFQEGQTNSKSGGPTRSQDLRVGIAEEELKTVQREVPASEPPPLAPNADLKVVGKPTERWDGKAKVTGAARYTADIRLPGMLYAKMVNASVPHAKVLNIDTSKAERYPGVKAVYVITHVDGNAELRIKAKRFHRSTPSFAMRASQSPL